MSPITHRAAAAARPGDKLTDTTVVPGGGRLVLVCKAGTKSWVLRVRRAGRDTSAKLGEFPAMSVAEARERVLQIASGARPDPRVRGGTLLDLLNGYAASLGERRSARDVRNLTTSMFGRELQHPLLARAANQVEPHEVADILRGKVAAGNRASVNRIRTALHAAYAWGLRADNDPLRPLGTTLFRLKSNPVAAVPKVAAFEVPRNVVIPAAALPQLYAAAVAEHPFAALALLTGQRVAQLAGATVTDDVLTIVDTKGRGARPKRNDLPVTPPIRAALAAGALSLPGGVKALRRVLGGYRATDVRRTLETFLAERGFSGEERGRLLSHGLERASLVRAHYDMSTNLELKRRALDAWAAAMGA